MGKLRSTWRKDRDKQSNSGHFDGSHEQEPLVVDASYDIPYYYVLMYVLAEVG